MAQHARQNMNPYSRDVWEAPKRTSTRKRVVIGIVCFLGACLLTAGAFALWSTNALDRALAPSDEARRLTSEILVDTPANQPFYLLLLGSDSREGSNEEGYEGEAGTHERSDVIMLARIDVQTKTVTLVSIPRDTPYVIDGQVVKINEAYDHGGAAGSIEAVSKITGVSISHYAEVRLSEFEAIIDRVGGVEVYVDREMGVNDTITGERIELEPGLQTLNGKQAQVFVRARHAYEGMTGGEDYHRQGNVRTMIEAVVKKILSQPATELPGTILDLAQYVTTDLTSGDLVSLGLGFAGGGITMYSCTGPSAGDIAQQYNGIWLCYPNPEGWAELMRQVDSGAEPSDIDYAATQLPFDTLQ